MRPRYERPHCGTRECSKKTAPGNTVHSFGGTEGTTEAPGSAGICFPFFFFGSGCTISQRNSAFFFGCGCKALQLKPAFFFGFGCTPSQRIPAFFFGFGCKALQLNPALSVFAGFELHPTTMPAFFFFTGRELHPTVMPALLCLSPVLVSVAVLCFFFSIGVGELLALAWFV